MSANNSTSLRARAEELFAWGLEQNAYSGWEAHSRNTAEIAETIAKHSGLDADKAYALGLLHDIGKCDSNNHDGLMEHHLLGYKILMAHGLPEAARVAITHTFYEGQEMDHFWIIMEERGIKEETQSLLAEYSPFDNYDKLIQLADNMAHVKGITTIEARFCDVLTRHALPDPAGNLRALYSLKSHFDALCGENLYNLFRSQISQTIFT